MADLIIRGMEMPKDCPHCEFAAIGYASPMSSDCTLYCRAVDKFKDCATEILKDKPYEVISHYNDRPDWCPLVPLPEGHGRLIDADALDRAFTDLRFNSDGTLNHWGDRPGWCMHGYEVEKLIADAPTIVPAEGGGEE